MSLATEALSTAASRLPKLIDARIGARIDARTHGVIDYGHAAFFFGMALLCRKDNPRAAKAALVTGSFVLVQSLLTDYPLGAKPVIPFAMHGRMDTGFAAVSPLIPKFFGFEGTAAARVFQANALVEGTVVALTDFNSQHAREERGEAWAGSAEASLKSQ